MPTRRVSIHKMDKIILSIIFLLALTFDFILYFMAGDSTMKIVALVCIMLDILGFGYAISSTITRR
jgi:hypothetical protein